MKLDLKFNEGVGQVKLGMKKSEVDSIFNENPRSSQNNNGAFYYLNNALMIEFTQDDKVCYIELSNDDNITILLDGKNLFELKDCEIEKVLSKYGSLNKNEKEYPHVYSFPDLQLNFWRSSNPSKLENDMKQDLQDADSEEYEEIKQFYIEEINKFKFFQTVAIFDKRYYK